MNFLTSKLKPLSHSSISSRTLCISLFSTPSHRSYHSSVPRRNDDETRNVRVSVWWDIENCGVPTGSNVFKIAQSITAAIRTNGIKGPVQISAFGDVSCLSRANQEALSITGVNLIHIPNGARNSADRSLLVDLLHWVTQNPPPAHIFLISGDKDFAGILHRLRMNNYNILLSGSEGKYTPGALCSAATIMWHWDELAKGEGLSGRHFNQPPDGPFNSWYGHFKGALEDPYELPFFPKALKPIDSANNIEQSSDSQPSHVVEVQKHIRNIVNQYPVGLSINELRSQLSSKVTVDKNFYGFKKFTSLLFSMQRFIKVVDCGDGQFLIRPVSSKVREKMDDRDDTSVRSVAESKKQVVQVTSKEDVETQPITRMVEESLVEEKKIEPVLHASCHVVAKDKLIDEKVSDGSSRVVEAASANKDDGKDTVNVEAVKGASAPAEEQNTGGQMSIFRRVWTKWFSSSIAVDRKGIEAPDRFHTSSVCPEKANYEEETASKSPYEDEMCGPTDLPSNTASSGDAVDRKGIEAPDRFHTSSVCLEKANYEEETASKSPNGDEICGPTDLPSITASSSDAKSDRIVESEVSRVFFEGITRWWRDKSPVNTPTEQLSEELTPIHDAVKQEEAPQLKKHELFFKDTFWSTFESFLRTYRGIDIVLNSSSREQFAQRLKTDGPLVLSPLEETELLDLIEMLILDKKWIKEFPTQIPRFQVSVPPVKRSTSPKPPANSNMISSPEIPQPALSSIMQKTSEKSKPRSDILSDCQTLLDELLLENPEGLNIGRFKRMFLDKYGYSLDYQKLGYPKLVFLLQIMPGVKVDHSMVFPDNVVYAPGIASLGSKNNTSDKEMTYLPLKNEDVESQWEELGPVEKMGPGMVSVEYKSDDDDDDNELSDPEEEKSSSPQPRGNVNRKTVKEEDSSLLQILNSWHASNSETDQEVSVDCSREKPRKTCTDSLDRSKDKLIDGILGSLEKSGESRMVR